MDRDLSAPNPGRQSPDPERQSGAQQQSPPASGRASPERAPSPGHAQRESERAKQTVLQSNPVHPLEDEVARKLK